MERKNTILLTVIAVATLLVAVVGATFAYFTATTASEGVGQNVNVNTAVVGTGTVSVNGTSVNNQTYLAYPGGASVTGFQVVASDEDAANSFTASYNIGYTVKNSLTSPITYAIYASKDAQDAALDCKAEEKVAGEAAGEFRWYYSACNGLATYEGMTAVVGKTTLAAGENVTDTFAGTVLTTDTDDTYYYYLVVTYPDTNASQNDDQGLNIQAQITGITNAVTNVVAEQQ